MKLWIFILLLSSVFLIGCTPEDLLIFFDDDEEEIVEEPEPEPEGPVDKFECEGSIEVYSTCEDGVCTEIQRLDCTDYSGCAPDNIVSTWDCFQETGQCVEISSEDCAAKGEMCKGWKAEAHCGEVDSLLV